MMLLIFTMSLFEVNWFLTLMLILCHRGRCRGRVHDEGDGGDDVLVHLVKLVLRFCLQCQMKLFLPDLSIHSYRQLSLMMLFCILVLISSGFSIFKPDMFEV